MNRTEPSKDPLAPLRRQIDEIDAQVVKLLNDRARVVIEIGKVKCNGQTPTYSPEREQEILQRLRQLNTGPLPFACLEAIYRELMSGSFALERPLRIGFLGPVGSYSHLAAKKQFGTCVDYDPIDSITAVFAAVESKRIDLGLVPIENTIGGGIHESLDNFQNASVVACSEVLLAVHHQMLTREKSFKDVQAVYSRPEVFEQCRKWLAANLSHARQVALSSSSEAAKTAGSQPGAAAIGSTLAAELYSLPILQADIEDNPNNVTRFLVIGRQSTRPTGDDKTAILFATAHKPGALAAVLDVLRDHGVNLTHIDKRPSRRVNFEYDFFLDCQGHADDPNLAKALKAAAEHCLTLKVLGSFPRARSVLG